MKETLKSSTRSAAVMITFAVVFTGLMAAVYVLTRGIVEGNQNAARLALISQVLPVGSYDNDLLKSARTVSDPLLGDGEHQVFTASKAGTPLAVVVEATAPDGYSGAIDMLVGVFSDGHISGVRVVNHKETPGLGDYIDAAKSDWIKIFDGKSLQQPDNEGWQVKKDGGQFTHMAGATISPRAVVKAVHKALQYVAAHPQSATGVH